MAFVPQRVFMLQLAKLGRDSVHALTHEDTLRLSESAGRAAALRRRMSVVDVVGKWGCEKPFDSLSQDMLEKELPVSRLNFSDPKPLQLQPINSGGIFEENAWSEES